MNQRSNVTCPQCLHLNSTDAVKCGLCDWSLQSDQSDETRMPEETVPEVDANIVTAPNLEVPENQDPDQTQAPLSDKTESSHSISEKQTFYFAGNLSHFEIHEILGQGGMGAVYHAKDKTLHRDVAIKMLRPMAASSHFNTEALLEEARMASKLNHPNIVTIYDVARNQDSNYIVMEWIDGQPLDELIPPNGLALEKALEYACQIANGMTNAHQKYIIHKDIKPQNIMLSSENSIKILDFGIAGYLKQTHDNIENTDTSLGTEQASSGTPSYMSPEQAKGLNLDQRSDIFSFGIVLYQMLCGERPFIGENFTDLKNKICTGNYIPIQQQLPELPINVVQLIDKMLATAKDQRWQSSAELAEALQAIHKDLTYKKNWWQRRNWLSKSAIILPLVLAIGWSSKEILFPASTQQLIERQLLEANKIAILPFDNISGDPQIQLFSDGLAVNLGSDLAAIASHQGNTWIVPSTEISRMKDQSLKSVTDKYGVNLVLTGSIQHMGSTRLLVLNLLNGTDGQQLKTVEVSIDAENLFQGHAKIRRQALELLDWTIPEDLKAHFNSQRPQLDGAYKEYIKGIGYFYRFDQPKNLIKAELSFKKAIEISPTYSIAYIGLAESQLMNFRTSKNNKWLDEMEETINSLEAISINRCQVDYLKAELLTRKGEYQQAINLFSNCLNEDSKHIPSYLGLANAYAKNKDTVSAEIHYKKAIEISPNNVKSIIDFGIFYYKNGNYENTIEQSKILAKLAPNNLNAYKQMAGSYYSLGNIDEAISNTLFAIELKPTGFSYSNLATMYFSKKEYQKATLANEQAVKLKPTHYLLWGNLADSYKLTGDKKTKKTYIKATELANEALNNNPKDSSVIADLANYYANIGDKEKALELANQIGIDNNGFENIIVATAYDVLGETKLAIKHLQYAIDKNYSYEEITNSPLLANTRKDKDFKSLISLKK